MLSFKDVLKKSFLQGFARYDPSPTDIVLAMCIATLFAAYIFFVYRVLTKKNFYSKTFNISLAALTLITTAVILTIQSSVVISLGMVGALSIVRFRTAVKDPMDLVFLFWAITTGIICGAGFAEIAIVLALTLTLALFVLDRIPLARAPKILLASANGYETEEKIVQAVRAHCKYYTVKSRRMANDRIDLVVEVRTAEESALIRDVAAVPGMLSASLLHHDGEVTL